MLIKQNNVYLILMSVLTWNWAIEMGSGFRGWDLPSDSAIRQQRPKIKDIQSVISAGYVQSFSFNVFNKTAWSSELVKRLYKVSLSLYAYSVVCTMNIAWILHVWWSHSFSSIEIGQFLVRQIWCLILQNSNLSF